MLLENELIRLRAPEPEDLEYFYKWENNTSLWWMGNTLAPCSKFDIKQYISSPNDLYETGQFRLMITLKDSGTTVGIVDLYDFDPHHQRAAIGTITDGNYRQQGIGSAAISLICEYALSYLKLHQIYAYVPVSNVASLKMLKRCGFIERCLLPDWIIAPEGYQDVMLLTLVAG